VKKFIDGLKFGIGFGLAFLVILYLGLGFVVKMSTTVESDHKNLPSEDAFIPSESAPRPSNDNREKVPFSDLNIEDQIKHASVIALGENIKNEDGQVKTVITEILKKDKGVVFYYEEGVEYRSFYPRERVSYGDGVVIFFNGSPATMKRSMTYRGDRISSLGDMPLKLFREKCENPST